MHVSLKTNQAKKYENGKNAHNINDGFWGTDNGRLLARR